MQAALDGTSRMVDLQLEHLLPHVDGRRRFFRIDADLQSELEPIDDGSPRNIEAVYAFAEEVVQTHEADIDELSALLLRGAD